MITTSQVFVPASTSTVKLVDVPPGPCTVVISAIQSGAAISFGTASANLTATTGALVNAGQSVTLQIPAGSKAQTLYGSGVGGTAIAGIAITAPN